MDRGTHDNSQIGCAKSFLVVNPLLSDLTGGGEEVLLKILEALIERSQDLFLIGKLPTDNIFDNLPPLSVKQIRYPSDVYFKAKRFRVYRQLFNQLKTRNKLRREVGKIYLEISTQYPMHFINAGKKRVAYIHFPETLTYAQRPDVRHLRFWKLYYWPFTSLLKRQIKKIDLLMCNSCYTQKAIMDSWNREAEVIYPPADVEEFKPAQKEPLIVSVGRFAPAKNYEMIIQVAKQLPHVKFIIIGRKLPNDPYYDKIAKLKPNNVDLIAGATRADVAALLSRAKIYLHSMIGEHFGISIVEAMAAGCIPIVHNSGGPPEIVGSHGFLYNNVEECIKAIEEALQSKTNPNDITEQTKKFSTNNFKKNFITLLEKKGFL